RVVRQRHRPDETRLGDSTGEVVHPRTRTGLEEIDSDEGEGAAMLRAVGGAIRARHDAHVVHHEEAVPVAPGRPAFQIDESDRAVEVADRARVGLRALYSEASRAGREDVERPGDGHRHGAVERERRGCGGQEADESGNETGTRHVRASSWQGQWYISISSRMPRLRIPSKR